MGPYKIFHNMSYANPGYAVAAARGLWYRPAIDPRQAPARRPPL